MVGGTAAAVSVLRRALKPRTRYAPWEKVPFGEFPRKVLVAGGGFAGYMAAKTLCDLMKGRADIGVLVISRENYFAFCPMVPGIIGSEVDAPSTGHCSSGGDIRRGRERRTGNRAVSGPGRVLFQAALANFNPRASTSVDFHNDDRAPLLFIAGGKDHVSPAALNESNARRYLDSKALTVYEEFPLRSRFTLLEEGWELVADYALTWAIENAAVRRQPATT